MITKNACSKCKEVKAVSEFSKCLQNKSLVRSSCKKCANQANHKYLEENKLKISIYQKNYYSNNKETLKAKGVLYRIENKLAIKERANIFKLKSLENYHKEISKLSATKSRELIADRYIKSLLVIDIPKEAITPELIEAKRMQIKLHRLIKELR